MKSWHLFFDWTNEFQFYSKHLFGRRSVTFLTAWNSHSSWALVLGNSHFVYTLHSRIPLQEMILLLIESFRSYWHTVDGSEIPNNHRLGSINPCKEWDKLPFPQLVIAGFLNHQQYDSQTNHLENHLLLSSSSNQVLILQRLSHQFVPLLGWSSVVPMKRAVSVILKITLS